ncbi:MAG: OmpA family protein [Salibacteraceae bacterium]|nr:OmpA family protein [Salibacteraceae bacterium]
MSRFIKIFIVVGLTIAFLGSCVPQKKYAELQKNYEKSESERGYLSGAVKDHETERNELKAQVEKLTKDFDNLSREYDDTKQDHDVLKGRYQKLEVFKQQLLANQEKSSAVNQKENQKLLKEMIRAQEDLQKKEDELNRKEAELNKVAAQLDGYKADLQKLEKDLDSRSKRINELEQMIADKDAAVRALKDKITNALLNFKDKGLTVTQKNGRIYVSMEAKLLFPSGSTVVNAEGKSALVQLSKVLEKQSDITILVEGHTDIDPMSGTGLIKDNWDLSVMRSTSVVRLMLNNSKIDASLLTAAGRGQFVPVDPAKTAAAKAKNRRIEIILTPNLDQLFKILDEEAQKLGSTKDEDPDLEESDDDVNKPE